jgi:hypothetical protein
LPPEDRIRILRTIEAAKTASKFISGRRRNDLDSDRMLVFARGQGDRDSWWGNLDAAPLENGEVQAKTALLVYRSHLETDHQLLSGCREDLLRKVNGAWKVARRTIVLDANVSLDKKLSVFLSWKTPVCQTVIELR